MAAKKTARKAVHGAGAKPARTAKAQAAPKGAARTPASATHHAVRRKQHESEAAQDYCEAIAELLDDGVEARVGRIAERFGLSHVTVSRVVRRLAAAPSLRTGFPPSVRAGASAGRALAVSRRRCVRYGRM